MEVIFWCTERKINCENFFKLSCFVAIKLVLPDPGKFPGFIKFPSIPGVKKRSSDSTWQTARKTPEILKCKFIQISYKNKEFSQDFC